MSTGERTGAYCGSGKVLQTLGLHSLKCGVKLGKGGKNLCIAPISKRIPACENEFLAIVHLSHLQVRQFNTVLLV